MADITHAQLMAEIKSLREEQRQSFEKLNGRVRNVEVCQAADHADIENLEDRVRTLSILDKSIAVLSGIAAAVFAWFAGK